MAHDLDGSELVCIHDNHSNTLMGINVTALVNVRRGRGVKAFEFKASAAQPIRATRHNYYDILLVQSGKLKLWIGSGTALVDISLPNNIHELDASLTSPPDQTKRKELRTLVRQLSITEETLLVTELKDPTHNKINVTMSNSRTYRITVDFTPKSKLVQDCLMALSFAVPINVFQSIRQRFMYHQYSEEWRLEGGDSDTDEWDHFASAIFCFLHGDEMERGELLASLENENVATTTDFLDQPAYSNFISGLKLGEDIQGLIGNQSDNEASQAQYSTVKKWIYKSLESYEKRKTEESLVSNITSVVLGLHLIWEDLRLDKYRKQDTMDMGLLLSQLATILQWDEWKIYYIDFGIPDLSYDHSGKSFANFMPTTLRPI
jgi:anaphase-promoting complex subunit 1